WISDGHGSKTRIRAWTRYLPTTHRPAENRGGDFGESAGIGHTAVRLLRMADIVPPSRLTAFEYRGRLRGGRSRPMLVACRDQGGREHKVVLKLRDVPV